MSGFSLLEVMIALALLSCASLTLFSQSLKLQINLANNHYRTSAMHQIVCLRERLRINEDSVFQSREIQVWREETVSLLPRATAKASCQYHLCSVAIQWQYHGIQNLKKTFKF